jgi:SAM-dependent methyltransferase
MQSLQRSVLGCDYGGTSWTTRDEAHEVADWLALRPGVRLLDVGAGAGWPGLYLARQSGCDVVLTDIPMSGLILALERAACDGVGERCAVTVADGAALPFRAGSFDALSHSDVLCCMPAKLALLQECRRVALPGARMVFSVIAPAAGLSENERQLAIQSGPEFVDLDGDYGLLLDGSGWGVVRQIDVTAQFAQSIRTSLQVMSANAEALVEVLGKEEFAGRIDRRNSTLAGIDCGVLTRQIYITKAGPA